MAWHEVYEEEDGESIHGSDIPPPKNPDSEYARQETLEEILISDHVFCTVSPEYNYSTFLTHTKFCADRQKVHKQTSGTYPSSSVTCIDFSDNLTPFLTTGDDETIPCYSEKSSEDINIIFTNYIFFIIQVLITAIVILGLQKRMWYNLST